MKEYGCNRESDAEANIHIKTNSKWNSIYWRKNKHSTIKRNKRKTNGKRFKPAKCIMVSLMHTPPEDVLWRNFCWMSD